MAVSLYSFFEVSPLLTLTIIGCWPLAGSIITFDDDLPGGWSNPDGDEPFPWLIYVSTFLFFIAMVCTGYVIKLIFKTL